jgi:hypothetical protein
MAARSLGFIFPASLLAKLFVHAPEALQLLIVKRFQIQQQVPSIFIASDQLIYFEMHFSSIPILSILNQKDHQESNNRRRRVNYQLPTITETE